MLQETDEERKARISAIRREAGRRGGKAKVKKGFAMRPDIAELGRKKLEEMRNEEKSDS